METKPIRVYVAGPYTKGDVAINVRHAIEAGDRLWARGFVPFIPHFTHFWHMMFPKPYEAWTSYDLQWLPCCTCLLRLPGDSLGADNEVSRAKQLGIPVFLHEAALFAAYPEAELLSMN